MPLRPSTIPLEAVGVYWFVDDDVARNLVDARAKMREFHALGFTEVWIAERYITQLDGAPTALTAPSYGRFLDTVLGEADDLGLRVIPFFMACGLDGLEAAHFEHVLCATATATARDDRLDFGPVPEHWLDAGVLEQWASAAYRVVEGVLGPTIVSASVRSGPTRIELSIEGGRLAGVLDGADVARLAEDEELFVALRTRPGANTGPADATAADFRARLAEVVAFHDQRGAGHPSYAGLAFDEPNIVDPAPLGEKHLRSRRFYWSESVATLVPGLDEAPWKMARPDDVDGWSLRFRYYAAIQNALMEAIDAATAASPVPVLGTHDWSGDRDRALYNTFDQLQFTDVRTFGATDISGPQWHVDYAAVEPLLAYAQKEAYGRERAMLMTDHFRELTDLAWLLYTGERCAALGVDYLLLHAYGRITHDPPMWTRTETWAAYREPHALERYTARMKSLARFRDYEGEPDVLVVFPRLARLAHVGDRFVTREWSAVMFALHRAHYSPLTVSQADFDDIEFDGPVATWRGRAMGVVVLPYAGYLDDAQWARLQAFHEAGGHVVLTKPHDYFDSLESRARLDALFGIVERPRVLRFETGASVSYEGRDYAAFALPEATSEFDDCFLDFGGTSVLTAESAAGGRAVLLGFELAALIHGAEMHDVLGLGGVSLLGSVLSTMTPPSFSCLDGDGDGDPNVIGLVRRRGADLAFSAHRIHDRASIVRVGQSTVLVPAGRAADHPQVTGVNVFVNHVEEPGVVVVNPLSAAVDAVTWPAPIRSITTADGLHRWAWFEDSEIRMALPPSRELRFAEVAEGERYPELPVLLGVEGGEVLGVTVPVDTPSTTLIRLRGGEHMTLRLSLAAAHGEVVAARSRTTGVEAKVAPTTADGDRLVVELAVDVVPTMENDVEVTQSG